MQRLLPVWVLTGLVLTLPAPASAQNDGVHFEDGPSDKTYAIPHERARGQGGGGGGSSRSGVDDGAAAPFGAGVEGTNGTSSGGYAPTRGRERSSDRGSRGDEPDRAGGGHASSGSGPGPPGDSGTSEGRVESASGNFLNLQGLIWFVALLALVPIGGIVLARLVRRRGSAIH